MVGEKEVQSAVIQVGGWMIASTYVGKAKPLSHDRTEEKIKLIVSSLDKIRDNQFIYVFELLRLKDHGLIDAKDFKDLKEFHYYLKFNPENFRFKQRQGEGIISVFYLEAKKDKHAEKKPKIAQINNGNRFILETEHSKVQRIQKQKQLLEQQRKNREELDRNFQERPGYPIDTLVVDRLSTIMSAQAKQARKVVIRGGLMDLQSPECEMKNDRQIDKISVEGMLKQLRQMRQLESLTVQWHKLSTSKAISDILWACKGLNLKVINFDNLGNGFTKDSIAIFNKATEITAIQELNVFFNIWDEDNYFEESWWHPQHVDKYRGKSPIASEEWKQFAESHQFLSSMWVPNNGERDMELLKMRQWKKLSLGYYEDQEMSQEYWKVVKECFRDQSGLVSLCLSRIKNLEEEALIRILQSSKNTLQYLMLNWCEKETNKGLELLAECKGLLYLNIKHSPLQENKELSFAFLRGKDRLEFLNIDNFKGAKEEVVKYINSEESKGIKLVGLPRNDWVDIPLLRSLSTKQKLTKLNLYNVHGFDVKEGSEVLGSFKWLKVLNLGATDFDLVHIGEIVRGLKYLKKLNISDIKCEKTMNNTFYVQHWPQVKYPLEKEMKAYKEMDSFEKEQFVFLVNNLQIAAILPHLPRVTHLDIRNLGIDERPFANPKLIPLLRYVGCEFELYKKMQTLGRRGLTFV